MFSYFLVFIPSFQKCLLWILFCDFPFCCCSLSPFSLSLDFLPLPYMVLYGVSLSSLSLPIPLTLSLASCCIVSLHSCPIVSPHTQPIDFTLQGLWRSLISTTTSHDCFPSIIQINKEDQTEDQEIALTRVTQKRWTGFHDHTRSHSIQGFVTICSFGCNIFSQKWK